MRRTFVVLLVVAMLVTSLTAVGCKKEKPDEGVVKVIFTSNVSTLNDKGFNAASWTGLQRAAEDFGVKVTAIESKATTEYVKNVTIAAQNAALVVTAGFDLYDAVKEVAPKFPDTAFCTIDVAYDPPIPNVLGAVYAEHEGTYLAGILAAGVSKSNTIGYVGGMNVPSLHRFLGGYIAGARSYNPNIKILTGFIGDWIDQTKGKQIALSMIEQGADVILVVAGGGGVGAMRAAEERGVWAIGADTDQYEVAPGAMLSSVMKGVEVSAYEAAKLVATGQFSGGTMVFTLANDGVMLAPFHDHEDKVPQAVKDAIELAIQGIKAGTIEPPQDYPAGYGP